MKKLNVLMLSLAMMLLASCGASYTVPITGRKHSLSAEDGQLPSLAATEYQKYITGGKLSTDAAATQMVKRVGQRLANAVDQYLRANGYAAEANTYQWEFNLLADKEQNAFCMPGGKIAVYEGLLAVTQDEASLAIVMGHEIAHAVAKHSSEQMAKKTKASVGTQIFGAAASAFGLGTVGDLATTALSYGAYFTNLHGSRKNESEADYMGLIFAAMAGYDPNVAVTFWQRMAAQGGSTTASFLSTHPSDEKRIADIKKHLPEALKYYRPNGQPAASTGTATSGKNKKQRTQTVGTIRIK